MNKRNILIAIVILVALAVVVFCVEYFQEGKMHGLKVIYPNGGEVWTKGQNVKILWNAEKKVEFVNIRLEILGSEDAQNFNAAIVSNILNTGSYNWTVQDLYAEVWGIKTLPTSDKYVVVVEDSQHNNIYAKSDSVFSVK